MRKLFFALSLVLAAALLLSAAAVARPAAHTAVVGGVPAPEGTWPSAAFIEDDQGNNMAYLCTGTVVAPRVVLTAAHCVTDANASDYHVVSGSLDYTSDGAQRSDVTQTAVFPAFESNTLFGDAALLILANATTAPAMPLATLNDVGLLRKGRNLAFAGWGQTNVTDQTLPTSLRTGSIRLQDSTYCGRRAADLHMGFQPAGVICATSRDLNVGACHGDSGGPLVTMRADRTPVQIGITSVGAQGCVEQFPNYFTRADLVANWVNAWIASVAASNGGPVAAPTNVPPVSTHPPVGPLSNSEVPGDLRQAILAKMGGRFRGAKGYRSRCSRKSASSVRCNVSWSRQGTAYAGVVTIFLHYDQVQRLVVVESTAKFTKHAARH